MPYITRERQSELLVGEDVPETAGELNFFLTKLCIEFGGAKPNYEMYNSIIGALESCKLEFYRRAVSPYEDVKIETNGDVY